MGENLRQTMQDTRRAVEVSAHTLWRVRHSVTRTRWCVEDALAVLEESDRALERWRAAQGTAARTFRGEPPESA